MEMKPGYKLTEVGMIPEDWEVKPLSCIGRVIRGSSPRPKGDKRFYGGSVPRLMVEDVTRDQKFVTPAIDFLTIEGAKRSRPCKQGTLTVVCSGTPTVVGLPSILATDACIHDGMLALVQLDRSIDPEYLFYRLTSLQEQLHASATHGGTFVNLTTTGFGSFTITVPTLPEQTTIARTLSDVDALIGALEQLIAKKRDIKQGAMQELLTGKKRLPDFNGKWDVKRLGDVADIDPDNLSSTTAGDYTFNYISLENVDKGALRGYSEQVFWSAPSRARRRLRAGDILVSTVRPNLQSHLLFALTEPNWVCSTGFSVVRCSGQHSIPGYIIQHLFGHHVNKQIECLLAGSNYPAINSRDMKALEIPLPCLAEQEAIATILSDMDAEIAELEARLTKVRNIKQGMMQELLAGRIRLT